MPTSSPTKARVTEQAPHLQPAPRNDMDNTSIRHATPEDADDIARIHIAAWRQAYRGLMPDDVLDRLDVRTRADAWRDILEQIESPCLLAQIDGRTAGFISLCGSRDPDRDGQAVGEISAIYLDPACWRRGIGSRLVGSAMDILRSICGCWRVTMPPAPFTKAWVSSPTA